MICQKTKLPAYKVVLLLCLFSFSSYSQEAAKLFHEKYSKISIVFQPSILKKSAAYNNDGSRYPSMNFVEDFSYQFGIYYNFAQSGSFNFKTGIIAKEFVPKFDLNIANDDVFVGSDYLLTDYDPYNQFIIAIPFKTDYFLKINTKLNLVVGVGLSLNLITGTDTEVNTSIVVTSPSNTQQKTIFRASSNNSASINLSTEYSFGVNYKTNFALIDVSFFNNNSVFPDYVNGQYEIINLNNSPNKQGFFDIRNNFYGLSLSVSPKKGWLKRKSKK